MYKRWTDEEIKILKDNYQNQSFDYVCSKLLNRTKQSIQCKAYKLGLSYFGEDYNIYRFWSYVDKKLKNECWNWTGAIRRNYGYLIINYRKVNAHRFSWEIYFGEIFGGLCVLHKCDNPLCVNPNHLFLGTIQDNIKDRDNKNRQARGENNGNATLSQAEVKQIRYLARRFSQKEIAKIFDVRPACISKIYLNKTWKHIT